MKYTFTRPMFIKSFPLVLIIIAITLFSTRSYAQTKNYATVTPASGTTAYYTLLGLSAVAPGAAGAGTITNAGNAAIIAPSNPATLTANYFNVLGLYKGEGEAYLQLKFPAPVAAGKTAYIRFDPPTTSGVSVDLLNVVGGLTGLLSNNVVEVDAYTGATSTQDGTQIPIANVTSAVVKDAAGIYYFAVSSSSAYNSVRVRLRFRGNLLGLALGSSISLNVYTAFSYDPSNCAPAVFTSPGEGTGINVSLTPPVLNPERAIDGNLTTFSNLQSGLVGVGATASQSFYLPYAVSSSTDVAKIVLSQPATLLSLDVLKSIRIQAYNGNVPVGTIQSVTNLLNLQLLGLFSNDTPFAVYYAPGVPFDGIRVTIDNTISAGGNILSGGVKIYEVQRTVAKPSFAGAINGAITICGGSNLSLTANSPNPAFTYNFYKKVAGSPISSVATANAGTYSESGLAPGAYTYYIAAQKAGCTGESDRDSITVTVNPLLLLSTTTLSNAAVNKAYAKQINAATGGTVGYNYTVAAGSVLPGGLTLSSSGLISGTPTVAGIYNYNLTATDTFGCKVNAAYTLTVTATLVLSPAVLPNGTVGVAYPATLLPSPTGGTTPYTFTAVNLPPGLAISTAGEITGTPTQSGTFTFPVTVIDTDGNTVTTNFTIVVRNPLVLVPATLSDGTTGIAYPTQIIPAATGGSGVYTYTASNLPPGLSFTPGSREITGTPTQPGTYTVSVNVTDNEGKAASADYTIVVKDPLLLPGKVLADGTVGIIYPTETLPAATGGTGPYTYVATNLPPGLAFDAGTRQITGTPTQSGTFTLMVKVTDNAGASVTVPYTIKVTGTLNLPPTALADGVVGNPYTSQALPTLTGGTSPYTYAMNNLPAGLTFNPATRVISGTPTVGGTFTLTMNGSDSGGLTTSTDYLLNITVAAPTVAGVTLCSGNSATLSVANSTTGVTYNFYAATGSSPVATGTAYTTGALNQSATYYVEAVSGTAVSARVPVNVTVNPSPELPVITSSNQTISSGQTALLEARAGNGATVKWFATATGGTALATGGTFNTPVLTTTTIYYAGTENNTTGCTSLSRVPVTVTVANGPANPNCNAAASQQSGISGLLCVGCSIQGATNSVDADPNNYTQITLAVGVGSAGYQRLIFQRPGLATDSIRLNLETPTGLLDLSALGGITVNVMNGTTVLSSYPLNPSLVSLSLLGGNRFSATVLAGGIYDRVEVRFNPTVVALSSLRIYGAEVIFPNPIVVSGNQTVCSGNTASLSATPQGGTTLAWFAAATGGGALITGNTYTTPALTASTTYYIEVSKNGCANTTRIPVTVTVTPAVTNPVMAAVSPVCSGSSAVLSVDNPQAGITYNWFTTATGANLVFTGPVYTIPGLTANATYYVEASNGTCVSAGRTVANIIVNPLPVLPQIQASATTVNQGQTVRLTATSSESNVVFNWYNAADATTPVFTGPSYVTPPLNATTTFYVDATSTVTGCASSIRVQQTITVNGNGNPVPVECELPVSQSTGTNGVIVLARVDNPLLAIDGDQQTGSTLSMAAGVGGSVFQKVNFAGLSNVGDTVRIRLTSSDQLLSVGLLSNVTLTTYSGATSNNDVLPLNNGLINLQLLSNGAEAIITLVPAARFDGLELRLNSGLVGALAAVNFNYARRITKAPTVVSANVTACENSTATLTVSPVEADIVYKWYDAAGVYQGLATDGPTFVTPALTANTQYFVAATRGSCVGSKTVVNVTVTPAPLVPVLLSPTVQACQNADVTLQVQNPQTGVTYQWYNGTTLIPGATSSTYTVTNIQADATYAVEAIGSCGGSISAKATAAITVGSLMAPVVSPQSVTITAGQRTLLVASSPVAGVTYTWYITNPASPVSTPANGEDGRFFTPALTATTTYQVIAQNTLIGGCVSAASTVVVTVIAAPVNPSPVPCEAAVGPTITSTTGLLAALATVDNPNLAIDLDTATGSTLFIPLGSGSAIAQKVSFTGLSQVGDQIRIGISSPAGALSLATAANITVTTYNGGLSNNDEKAITNQLITLQLFDGGKNGIITFTPTQTFDGLQLKLNAGLLSALTSLNFNYAQRILLAPSVQAAALTACQGTAATLSVLNPVAGTTYNWYKNGVADGTGTTYQTDAAAVPGTYNYSVSASRNSCESVKVPVTVTVTPVAQAPVASSGNPLTTCFNTPVTLRVDQVTGVTYNWYDAATAGNLLAANTNAYTTPANLATGTTTFYVEAVNANACSSTAARTAVSITIKPNSTMADISVSGASGVLCSGSGAILTASSTTVTNPVFTWYSDAALTDAVFTGAVYNVPSVMANTTYYVTLRGDNKCENTAGNAEIVTLTVNPPAVASDITVTGNTTGLCAGATVSLSASANPGINNPVFTWYSDAALTVVVSNLPTFTSPALAGSTTYYVTVQGTNRCPNTAANAKVVTLLINPTASQSDIDVSGMPTSVCAGSGLRLTASSTTVVNPVFTWYSDAALTTPVYAGPVFDTDPLSTTTTYYVTVRGLNKCENLAADARIVVLSVNAPIVFNGTALTGASVSATYSVQINPASGGTPSYTYTIAAGSTLPAGLFLSAGGVISGTATTPGSYSFSIMAIDSKGCTAVAVFTMAVGFPPLVLPAATLPNGEVGSPYPVQILPQATGGKGPYTYVVTAGALPPGLTFNPLTREITGTPASGGTFTFTVTVTDANGTTATADYTIVVTVPAPAVAAGAACAGSSATLTVTNPIPGVSYNWYGSATGGAILGTGTSFQTPVVTGPVTYYAQGASGTAVSTRTAVAVTLKPTATTADITVSGVPATLCSGTGTTLTASSSTVTNPVFTWYIDASLTTVVSNDAILTVPPLTVTTSYYVTVQGLNSCENSAATARVVTLNVNPALVFNGTALSNATAMQNYSVQLNPATGGSPGYTYTVAPGSSLPNGLILSSTGVLSGTPTQQGTYNFTITAIDSKGCTATANFSLAIGGTAMTPLVLPPAMLPDGQVGSPYPTQLLPGATGGTMPYTYVATGLPPGLTYNPVTREITGTPTIGGTFTITVTVTDAAGSTATATYILVVTVPAPIAAGLETCPGSSVTLTVSNPVTGVTYNWFANASGGSIIYTGTTFSTPVVNGPVIYYVEGASGTAVSTRIAVAITTPATLASPVVSAQSSTFNSITFSWSPITGATSYEVSSDGGITWSAPSSGPLGTTAIVAGLQANATVTLLVRAKGSTTCQTSAAGRFTGTANNGGGGGGTSDAEIFIPNTFTPNGDGNNDIFYVYGNAIVKVKMRIYNQWGQFLYESLQKQNGWDGSYKGVMQPNGVYVYYVDLVLNDGTATMRKGTITLLR